MLAVGERKRFFLMTIPRTTEGEANSASWRDGGDVTVGKALMILGAMVLVPVFLSTTVDQSHSRVTVYTGTGFAGVDEQLEQSQGRCRSFELEGPVKSVRNDTIDVHVTLFSDANCVTAVSVVSGREQDTGLAPGDGRMSIRTDIQLTLLGEEGALSYSTLSR